MRLLTNATAAFPFAIAGLWMRELTFGFNPSASEVPPRDRPNQRASEQVNGRTRLNKVDGYLYGTLPNAISRRYRAAMFFEKRRRRRSHAHARWYTITKYTIRDIRYLTGNAHRTAFIGNFDSLRCNVFRSCRRASAANSDRIVILNRKRSDFTARRERSLCVIRVYPAQKFPRIFPDIA